MFVCPAGAVEEPADVDDLLFPPQPAAANTATSPTMSAAIARRFTCHLQRSRQDNRPREMAWPVGIEAAGLCERDGGALDGHELGHRVEAALDHRRPGGADVVHEPVLGAADDPYERALAGGADRPVPVFHGGVGLRPGAARLPELEGGLAGQAH